jgi:hypothetical protein
MTQVGINERNIRLQNLAELQQFLGTAGLANDGEVGLFVDEVAQAAPEEGVGVGDHDAAARIGLLSLRHDGMSSIRGA